MIADRELEMSTAGPIPVDVAPQQQKRRYPFQQLAVYCLFLGVVIFLQLASGAYHSEFSGYPDEPAHYVTSLMLRNYILHFHFEAPLRFAEEYYRHYPKVAFGHWPPVFYILQSLWMILFSVSRSSVRLEIAVTAALLAYAVFLEARRWFGSAAGVLAGLLTIALPLMQDYSDQEMAEALLTLCCFWSVVYFTRYVQAERPRDNWLFAVFVSLAVLTKGSGWLLVMVPPIILVLTRRLRLLAKPSFWAPFALVAVTCVPWQLLTMRMAERGWDGGTKPSLSYTTSALVAFLGLFPKILGPLSVVFLLVGIGILIVRPLTKSFVSPPAAAQFALLVSVWIFHSIVPAGVEDRKLVLAVPSMVLLAFAGARYLADLLPSGNPFRKSRYLLVGAVGVGAFFVTTFTVPKLPHYGFIEAARFLTAREDLQNATVLVSSEAGGEGLLISEMAMDQPTPGDVVIRGTKALAEVAWDGSDYRSIYSTPQQITQYLRDEHVQVVVLDTFAPLNHFAHNSLLRQAVQGSARCSLLARFPSKSADLEGEVQVFRVTQR